MNKITFSHHFCESRIQNNDGPEYYNSFSSLFITIIPFVNGLPNNIYFRKLSYMLILNGFFSFYYHYSLSWLGKHLDEVTMILANYYGICGLLKFFTKSYENKYRIVNSIVLPVFISINTLPHLDYLFPHLFTLYVSYSVYLIYYCINTFDMQRKTVLKYKCVSLVGGACWIISEYACNEITQYGHIVWHLLFPLGLYKIVLIFDDCLTYRDIGDEKI